MSENTLKDLYPVPDGVRENALISKDKYEAMYKESIDDPDGFWGKMAERLTWHKKWDKVSEWEFNTPDIKWFIGGQLNVSYNCLDRHVEAGDGDKPSIIWEGEMGDERTYTYATLLTEVKKFANVMKNKGIVKGDRVCIYMPMVPELAIAMLACTRIGAIHSIVFGGFSADSLRDRINDSSCKMLITTDASYRGKKIVPLKTNADDAMKDTPSIETCVVYNRTNTDVPMQDGRDVWWNDEMDAASEDCAPEWMDAEDPLFILYTSGSTGKPKGVQHTTGGYLLYASMTHEYVFDYHEDDVYWCTADIGWVTGHSYIVYGPLANGANTIMFEGVPSYPDFGRFWQVVEKYKVTIFYTAPTAIRACMREGDAWVEKYDTSSLRVLGTVGEPINPEAWRWYYHVVGAGKCPIVDTWWQTETGGILITPLVGAIDLKPGSATKPFFGVNPILVDPDGKILEGAASGNLCIDRPWPGIMRTLYGDHKRFYETYFSTYKGYYMTGDGCRRDEDGYYWITGRVDDVINVSGHRMGTAEVESALVSHPVVAESAVVGFPHEIKGQGIYAYVSLNAGTEYTEELKRELVLHVRKEIGPIAAPDVIHWAPALPKTRSGKIMRRILRKIASNEADQVGDTSTLADPSAVEALIEEFKKMQG
ncbi:MAG: acetate--CoA ligase [bacterium]|nr:acetate--CoA ligase [bacterium]